MNTSQWPQEIVVKPLEDIITSTCAKMPRLQPQPATAAGAAAGGGGGGGGERRSVRPEKEHALNCPRCNSTNTKFCYYNNYSLTQPRYFCKTCRRYWTAGGTLRNIPVGGGTRKNKKSNFHSSNGNHTISYPSNSSSSQLPAPKKHLSEHHLMDMTHQGLTHQNPKFHDTQDLNLGFPHGFRSNFTELIQNIGNSSSQVFVPSCSSTSAVMSATSLADIPSSNNRSSNTFMGLPIHHQDQSGFSVQDHYKPCTTTEAPTLLGFSLDDHGFHGVHQEEGNSVNGGRLLFPFEDLKVPISSSAAASTDPNDTTMRETNNQKQGSDAAVSAGYWTGMLSGGSW